MVKEDELGMEKIRNEGYEVYPLKKRFEIIKNLRCDIFISDIRDTEVDYMKKARKISKCLLTFDDLGKGRHFADILVDANINKHFDLGNNERKGNLPIYLYGASYILLREEFSNCPQKKIKEKVKKILVTMGGSDHKGITIKAVEAIEEIKQSLEVVVIMGRGFSREEELRKIVENSYKKYILKHDEEKIYKDMQWADLAIAGAGVTMFELLCCGTPSLIIPLDEDQEKNTNQFVERNLIINLGVGEYLTKEKISFILNNLMENYETRERISRESQNFVDGQGLFRILEVIKNYRRK
jgi:spore coat polysaccharide biosynthesis predicted glycosyltransferase SpsG